MKKYRGLNSREAGIIAGALFAISACLYGCNKVRFAPSHVPVAKHSPAPSPSVSSVGVLTITPTAIPTPSPVTRQTFAAMVATGKAGIAQLDAQEAARVARIKREEEAERKAREAKVAKAAADKARRDKRIAELRAEIARAEAQK